MLFLLESLHGKLCRSCVSSGRWQARTEPESGPLLSPGKLIFVGKFKEKYPLAKPSRTHLMFHFWGFTGVIDDPRAQAGSVQPQAGEVEVPLMGVSPFGEHTHLERPTSKATLMEKLCWGGRFLSLEQWGQHCKRAGGNGLGPELGEIRARAKRAHFLHKSSCSNALTHRQLECKQLIVKVE